MAAVFRPRAAVRMLALSDHRAVSLAMEAYRRAVYLQQVRVPNREEVVRCRIQSAPRMQNSPAKMFSTLTWLWLAN